MKLLKTPGALIGLAALAIALAATVLWFYLAGQVRLPENRTPFVLTYLFVVGLAIFAYIKGTGILGGVPTAGALFIGLFLLFTMYISPQVLDDSKAIAVGDTIPQFTALDGNGETFDSLSLNGHLVLIKFFRAHW